MQQQDGEAQRIFVLNEADPLVADLRHDEWEWLREVLRMELDLE